MKPNQPNKRGFISRVGDLFSSLTIKHYNFTSEEEAELSDIMHKQAQQITISRKSELLFRKLLHHSIYHIKITLYKNRHWNVSEEEARGIFIDAYNVAVNNINKANKYIEQGKFTHWFITICKLQCRARWTTERRREKRGLSGDFDKQILKFEPESKDETHLEDLECREAFEHILAKMSETHRTAFEIREECKGEKEAVMIKRITVELDKKYSAAKKISERSKDEFLKLCAADPLFGNLTFIKTEFAAINNKKKKGKNDSNDFIQILFILILKITYFYGVFSLPHTI